MCVDQAYENILGGHTFPIKYESKKVYSQLLSRIDGRDQYIPQQTA